MAPMEQRQQPRWVWALQIAGSILCMVAGAYLGPRVEFGPQSQALRCVLIAVVGYTVWYWVIFLIWVSTRT
jgi:hypothetical protein